MFIEADVRAKAAHYNLDPAMVQAVVRAEGPHYDDILRAVRCSLPATKTRDEALTVVCRSLIHRLWEFTKEHYPLGFAGYMGLHWAPEKANNDPSNLNRNWPSNFYKLWTGKE